MMETGKPDPHSPGDFIEECGCRYFYSTRLGESEKMYVDICASHYQQGRR
jgi:hypothetical protein